MLSEAPASKPDKATIPKPVEVRLRTSRRDKRAVVKGGKVKGERSDPEFV
jgi:hypothetical protein